MVTGWSRGVYVVVTWRLQGGYEKVSGWLGVGYGVVTGCRRGGYGLVRGWKRGVNRWGLRFLVMMVKEIRIWPAFCLS